jgi:hypothetical protein
MANLNLGFGSCCVCERAEGVRNILMLHQKAPTSGRGWGCFVCDLSNDGATAVVCDGCLNKKLRFACDGEEARIPVEQLKGYHLHDLRKHTELHQSPDILYTELHWFTESPDEGHPLCLCSWCGHRIEAIENESEDDPEHEIAVRMWNGKNQEARFHHACFEQVLNLGVLAIINQKANAQGS